MTRKCRLAVKRSLSSLRQFFPLLFRARPSSRPPFKVSENQLTKRSMTIHHQSAALRGAIQKIFSILLTPGVLRFGYFPSPRQLENNKLTEVFVRFSATAPFKFQGRFCISRRKMEMLPCSTTIYSGRRRCQPGSRCGQIGRRGLAVDGGGDNRNRKI